MRAEIYTVHLAMNCGFVDRPDSSIEQRLRKERNGSCPTIEKAAYMEVLSKHLLAATGRRRHPLLKN